MLRIFSSGRVSDPFTARITLLRSAVGFSGLDLDFEAWVSFYLFDEGPFLATCRARTRDRTVRMTVRAGSAYDRRIAISSDCLSTTPPLLIMVLRTVSAP